MFLKSMVVSTVWVLCLFTQAASGSPSELCPNCSLKITFSDATGTGAGPEARESAECFASTLLLISRMPMQSAPRSSAVGVAFDVGTYPEYAAANGLDAIDVAPVARDVAKYCLKGLAGYFIELEVQGQANSTGTNSNVGTIGH